MSVSVGQVRLKDAMKQLSMRIDRAKSQWDDAAMKQLHQDVVEPLPPKVNAALGAMSRLGELIASVRRDCE